MIYKSDKNNIIKLWLLKKLIGYQIHSFDRGLKMSGTILQTCKINIVSPKFMDVVLRIDRQYCYAKRLKPSVDLYQN
jgi:hypothetical protein